MPDRIVDARDLLGVHTPEQYRAWLMAGDGQRARMVGIDSGAVPGAHVRAPLATRAIARVEHGRWIADCPGADCSGAMMVAPNLPFLCGSCFNADVPGRGWRLVQWPADKTAIERLLELRPNPTNRNWFPHETVADLVAENIAHGLAVA